MPLGLADIGLLLLTFLLPFALLIVGLPPFLRFLARKGRVLDDVHKNPRPRFPRPSDRSSSWPHW